MSMTMWEMGDDVARGDVEECPVCENLTLRDGVCEECGYDVADDSNDHAYDAHKDALVEFARLEEGRE